MKINLPVIDTEHVLKDMDSVISGTDPKGTSILSMQISSGSADLPRRSRSVRCTISCTIRTC